MRNVYLIAYDIRDPKRWRHIYRIMCGAGDAVQYSVFRCELTDVELHKIQTALWSELNLNEDRIMVVDLGPIDGRGDGCIEFWGNPKVEPSDRSATII
jgi:CRISPR-associated protein Cas2